MCVEGEVLATLKSWRPTSGFMDFISRTMSSMSLLSIWLPELSWSLLDSEGEQLVENKQIKPKKKKKCKSTFEAITTQAVNQFSLSEESFELTPVIQTEVSDVALGHNQSLAWPNRVKCSVHLGSQGFADLLLTGHSQFTCKRHFRSK